MFGDPCGWVRSRLPLLAGDDLIGPDRRRVQRHLIGCPPCRQRLGALQETMEVLHAAAALAPAPVEAPSLWPDLARQIRESRRPVPGWALSWPKLALWSGVGLAAGLAVALGLGLAQPRGLVKPPLVQQSPAPRTAPIQVVSSPARPDSNPVPTAPTQVSAPNRFPAIPPAPAMTDRQVAAKPPTPAEVPSAPRRADLDRLPPSLSDVRDTQPTH